MTHKKNRTAFNCEETGVKVFMPGSRRSFAFLYPNIYSVGMSNLGLHILYRQINSRGDTACERFFLPAGAAAGLLSMETKRPLSAFPTIGVMLSFELDYFNFLSMLEMGKIPVYQAKRGEYDPLVIAGGPCATFNPLPLALFVDAFVIGEGEDTINDILDALDDNMPRREKLARLADIDGVYVPAVHDTQADFTVKRRWVKDIDKYAGHYEIITNETEFSGMFAIEVARGCGRHCRFCMAGYCFRNMRPRKLEKLWQAIEARPANSTRVGLLGAAVCDHPEIKELIGRLSERAIPFSLSSLRADMLDAQLGKALAKSGQKTLTIAPEAGSERLRRVINKGITEEDVLNCVKIAAQAGIPNIKLYFMIGLPSEQDEDIEALANLAGKTRRAMDEAGSRGRLSLSVNPFIAKPFTPFQWNDMLPEKTLKTRIAYLRASCQKLPRVEFSAESLRLSFAQAALAKGGRGMGEILLAAYRAGGLNAFAGKIKTLAQKPLYQPGDDLPWRHIDMGFSEEYLLAEREKALAGQTTAPCSGGCRRCGVCEG